MMNVEHTKPMSFINRVKMAIVAGVILCVGFMTSVFVLTLSAIMLPFVTVGMWFLQKRVREEFEENFSEQAREDVQATAASTSA